MPIERPSNSAITAPLNSRDAQNLETLMQALFGEGLSFADRGVAPLSFKVTTTDPPTTGTVWLGGANSWTSLAALADNSTVKFFNRVVGDLTTDVGPFLNTFSTAVISFSWDGGLAAFRVDAASTASNVVTFTLFGTPLLVKAGASFPTGEDVVAFNFQLITSGSALTGPQGPIGPTGPTGPAGTAGVDGRDAGEAVFYGATEPSATASGTLWYSTA